MFRWSFGPESPEIRSVREAYVPVKKPKHCHWSAPEHIRLAQDMKRDYPRNDMGEKIDGRPRELVIDPRPTCMIPPRRTRLGWL